LGALEFLEWPKGHEFIVFVNLWVLYVVGAVKMASLCPTSGRLFVSGEMVLKYRTGNFCNFQSNETRNEYEEEVQKV